MIFDRLNLKNSVLILLVIVTCHSFAKANYRDCAAFDLVQQNKQKDSFILENKYVIVNKDKTVNAIGNDSSISERVIVALTDVRIKSTKGKIKLHRGETAVFQYAESYEIKKGEYFEISIKKNHPKPMKPKVWYEPTKNKSVFENEDFRIFKEQLGAGEERAFHSHLERLVVRLNRVQLTDPRFYPNGQEGVGIQEPNTVKFAEPVEHVVKNLGKIPLFNIVLEFKP